MDFFTFFVLVCLAALLLYARSIEKRRRRDAQRHNDTAAALTARIHALEQELQHSKAPLAGHPVMPPAPVEKKPATPPAPAVPPKPYAAIASPAGTAQHPLEGKRPAPGEVPPSVPRVSEIGGIPLTPPAPAREAAPAPLATAASTSATLGKDATPISAIPAEPIGRPVFMAGAAASASAVSHAAPPPTAGMVRPPQPHSSQGTQGQGSFTGPYSASAPKSKRSSISLEESLGTNWFPKVGITLVVLGVAFLMGTFWGNIGPGGRAAILYAAALGVLGGGVFLERKERYRKVGRALIGGGWAITFVMTYAINHVPQIRVLPSDTADLFLMVAVAGVMVWHTLKYNSQTVTGIAFLLGFASVTLNPDPPYSLVAAAILVSGLTVIVLRRQWFELEIFGILASYLNHFYWLYTIIHPMSEKGPFPQYRSSVALMVLYWTIFRASYLLRKVSSTGQESLSTIAALLNTLGFIAVMKYQSLHPEWAFRALLAVGAIEFILGQLPVSRRRKAPFQVLSSLGTTLMVVAVPFKYAGSHSLELLWMAGAEAFLLAGIFTRERLFRQFAGLISLLVAVYLFAWPPNGIIHEVARIMTGQPHHDAALGLVLSVIAALFYINSHVMGRIWERLFNLEIEKQSITALSFAASLFAVGAIYALAPSNAAAVVLAMLMTALAWTGERFRISQLTYQAHWIAVVAIAEASITGIHLDAAWHSLPERLITFGLVAALLYLSSNFVRLSAVSDQEFTTVLYRWAGSGLITLAIWMQIRYAPVRRDWLIAMLWTAFALVISGVAQLRKRSEFQWQAFVLGMMSFCCALAVNFGYSGQFHHISYRLISVTLVAGGIYLLARWSPIRRVQPAYSWAGTVLFAYLAYRETQEQHELWTAVLWVALAVVLGLAARYWKDRSLLWQTHLLSAVAASWTIAISFLGNSEYHGTRAQLITVLLTSAMLYGLAWITNIRGVIASDEIWQTYSWAGSLLLTWLAWYQLQPINVSLAWGVFALVLFELGYNTSSSYLRSQAYLALTCSFAHLFYSNFNTPLAATGFDLRILLIVMLVPIYFWVYWRLHEKADAKSGTEKKLRVEILLASLGTATVAALARFELSAEAVVVGYSAMVLALLITTWWSKIQIFLYQALIMLGMAAFRLSMHNFRNLHDSFISALPGALWSIGLLAASIPVAFLLRSRPSARPEQAPMQRNWIAFLVQRPEQPLFFASVILMAALLSIKLPDMITLAWGIEGVVVFLLALVARERSFRLTGFALVVICVAKIAGWDAWRMNDPRARYLTFIGVGVVILVVSYLYARYKEALREYL